MAEKSHAYNELVKLLEALDLDPNNVISVSADHEWLDVVTRNHATGDIVENHWRMEVPIIAGENN